MPRYGHNFDEALMITVRSELKEHLMAIGYYQGQAGEYASAARNLLARAVEDFYLNLDPREQRKYDTILKAVQAERQIKAQQRAERKRAKSKDESILTGRLESW